MSEKPRAKAKQERKRPHPWEWYKDLDALDKVRIGVPLVGTVALFGASAVGAITRSSEGPAPNTAKVIQHDLKGQKKPLERFKWLEGLTAKDVNELSGQELFANATKVQSSVLAIGKDVSLSGQEIFQRLVSPAAREAYANNHVNFLFVENDPNNPDCLNPFSVDGKDGRLIEAFIPLDASPDNPHPDQNPLTESHRPLNIGVPGPNDTPQQAGQ